MNIFQVLGFDVDNHTIRFVDITCNDSPYLAQQFVSVLNSVILGEVINIYQVVYYL